MKLLYKNIMIIVFLVIVTIYKGSEIYSIFSKSSLSIMHKILLFICGLLVGAFLLNFRSLLFMIPISKKKWIITFLCFLVGVAGLFFILRK